jgi:hypothetical protein
MLSSPPKISQASILRECLADSLSAGHFFQGDGHVKDLALPGCKKFLC